MKDYVIVEGSDIQDLRALVMELARKGFEPLGPPTIMPMMENPIKAEPLTPRFITPCYQALALCDCHE